MNTLRTGTTAARNRAVRLGCTIVLTPAVEACTAAGAPKAAVAKLMIKSAEIFNWCIQEVVGLCWVAAAGADGLLAELCAVVVGGFSRRK